MHKMSLREDGSFKTVMCLGTGNYKLTFLDKFSIRWLFPKKQELV